MSDNTTVKADPFAPKRLARLVAVQALYQASFEQEELSVILRRCLDDVSAGLNDEEGEGEVILEKPDSTLLLQIVHGVMDHREALEEMVIGSLSEKLASGRMETLLKAILLAGAFELHHHAKIATGIIISDYVDVARAFFNAKEPALVNAVLDRLGKTLRA